MTFLEAKEKLKKLAGGEHHQLAYTMTEHQTGAMSCECSIYIHGGDFHHGTTWAAAFESMANGPDMSEAPE